MCLKFRQDTLELLCCCKLYNPRIKICNFLESDTEQCVVNQLNNKMILQFGFVPITENLEMNFENVKSEKDLNE